ncbi:MAG: HEAT repeat domain-containing protein [Phototrophicaceae bacterium]
MNAVKPYACVTHKIQYGQYMIDNQQLKRGIKWLSQINHPDAQAIIIHIATTSIKQNYTRQAVARVLMDVGTPAAIDCLLTHYDDVYVSSPILLQQIHIIHDPRIVPKLIAQLTIRLHKPPSTVTRLIIEVLGKLRAIEAVPLLEQVIETFPFSSKTVFVDSQPLALMAIIALHKIDDVHAQAVAKKWQIAWDAHTAYHLQQDTIFDDAYTKLTFIRYLADNITIRAYFIAKLETETFENQKKIVLAIFLRVLPIAEDRTALLTQLIQLTECIKHQPIHPIMLARLSRYQHDELLALAFIYIHDEAYTEACIRIFNTNGVRSDTITATINEALNQQEITSQVFSQYLKYVEQLPIDEAVAIVSSYTLTLDDQKLYKVLYHTIGHLAYQSDTALNILCEIIQNGHSQQQIAAISALRNARERGLWILMSLIKTKSPYIATVLRTLSTPIFAEAVPQLIQELLNSHPYQSRSILNTLKLIGTEPAYAAINAWYETYNYLP